MTNTRKPEDHWKRSVVLCQEASYEEIQDKVDKVFEKFPRSWAGRKVLVKPNMLGPYAAEKAITTHPALVRAVVRRLKALGAEVTVGDNPGHIGYGINQKAANVTGIIDAAEGCYKNIGAESIKVSVSGQDVCISKEIMDCDVLISLPKFKTHMYTTITGAVKNSYGILVGREKSKLHQIFRKPEDFATIVTQVYAIRPPDLIIMDAIVGMEGDGPNTSSLRNINQLIASDNGVALDTVMCAMIGIEPESVNFLRVAKKMGLGPTSLDDIDINGQLIRLEDFMLPATYKKTDTIRQYFVDKILGRGKIVFDYSKCTGCRMCMQACPQQVISANKKHKNFRPVVDHSGCILCFCCKEMCQFEAVRLSGLFSFLQRIRNSLPF